MNPCLSLGDEENIGFSFGAEDSGVSLLDLDNCSDDNSFWNNLVGNFVTIFFISSADNTYTFNHHPLWIYDDMPFHTHACENIISYNEIDSKLLYHRTRTMIFCYSYFVSNFLYSMNMNSVIFFFLRNHQEQVMINLICSLSKYHVCGSSWHKYFWVCTDTNLISSFYTKGWEPRVAAIIHINLTYRYRGNV